MEDYNLIKYVDTVFYLIKRKGISVGDFEEKIGVSRGYLSRVIKGNKTGLNTSILFAISRELEMYIDDIFFYDRRPDELQDMKDEEAELEERLKELKTKIKEREK